jgi:hypothetical protein
MLVFLQVQFGDQGQLGCKPNGVQSIFVLSKGFCFKSNRIIIDWHEFFPKPMSPPYLLIIS